VRSTIGDGYDLFWGDFHKHISQPPGNLDRIDEALEDARHNDIDVYPVLCYPFQWYRKGLDPGIREETVGNRPRFLEWWELINETAAAHNDPGSFVALPAYEWHGDRTRWGDHNVVYFEEGQPLDDARALADLYDHLRDREALALPHHTGYRVGNRGKDWSVFDPELSPVMEVYSGHGSSEGVDTPVAMESNPSMGPRTSGGTYRDGLDRGHRVGALASNDGTGLPGSWNDGVAGVWADELTRGAIREALEQRRTYGTTGDRMELWYELGGEPMGSVLDGAPSDGVTASVGVDCPRPLDRIELVCDGRVADTYCHQGTWASDDAVETYTVLVEFGWGPTRNYGAFEDTEIDWQGRLAVEGGSLQAVQPRFSGWGQRYERDGDEVPFDVTTSRDGSDYDTTQGLILSVAGDADTELRVDLPDRDDETVTFGDAFDRSHLFAFTGESMDRITDEFDLTREDVENTDPVYHNARKLKVHPVHPKTACATSVTFDDLPDGEYYYVRASQVDGQYAWTSPVWIE